MGQQATLQDIEISSIDLDVSNHRHVADDAALQELAESIRVHGLLEPVSVYKHLGEDRYSLGFGHRRLEAHKLLGLKTIKAIVHQPAPESQIRAAQAIENLHRKDLTPMEEAQACQQLVVSLQQGQDVEPTSDILDTASAMVGRTRTWFENRLALMRLSPKVQKLLQEGRLYLAHVHYIARLPEHEAQEEVAEACAAEDAGSWEGKKGDREMPQPVYFCRGMVDDRLQDLSKVSWELDAEFAGKIACSKCPHNSANQPGLFDGDQPKKPMCLEGGCFKEKTRVAGLAVLRASNTLAKQGAVTPANADKAIQEREVQFVKKKAVMEAAATKLKPTRETAGERAGRKFADNQREETDAEREAREKFETALGKWREQRDDLLAKELRRTPMRTAMILLLQMSNAYDDANSDWRSEKLTTAAIKKLKPTLALLKDAKATTLEKLVKAAAPDDKSTYWPLDQYNGIGNDLLGDALAEALCIGLPKRPEKPAPAKAEKPKAKKAA